MGSTIGVLKGAARRVGTSFDEYQSRIAHGERWCVGCKAWHCAAAFGPDRNRPDGLARTCLAYRRQRSKALYVPHPATHHGPRPYPPRDGDKKQARQRINVEVRTGHRPHPNTLPCADCGHVWADGERRHEYDHYLGYAAEHHYDVESVCTDCHHQREEARADREWNELPEVVR